MGKVRKLRQKFHIATKGDKTNDQKTITNEVPVYKPLVISPISENVFAGLKINFDNLNELKHSNIPDDIDTTDNKEDNNLSAALLKLRSSSKQINKKDKIRNRREMLLKKINGVQNAIQQKKKEVLAKKKREKTVITGDLKPLQDALPSLESLLKLKPKRDEIKTGISHIDSKQQQQKKPILQLQSSNLNKKARKELKKQKIKKLAKEYKQRFNHIQQVLTDETFKKNPREAIAMHIKLTMQEQENAAAVELKNKK